MKMHFSARAVFGCDLDINMVCGAQLKSDNSNEEDLACRQRGGVARTEKSQSHPLMGLLLLCAAWVCATKIISLSLAALFLSLSTPQFGAAGVAFPRF
jgi:hypothetical protein